MPGDHLGLADQAPSGLNNLGGEDLYSCFAWSSATPAALESPASGVHPPRLQPHAHQGLHRALMQLAACSPRPHPIQPSQGYP